MKSRIAEHKYIRPLEGLFLSLGILVVCWLTRVLDPPHRVISHLHNVMRLGVKIFNPVLSRF